MQYSHIFFDLDGTLIDSKPGIIGSVQHALKSFHISVPSEELLPFIGPPLRDSFAQFFPGDTAKVERAIATYREYYQARGIFENSLYPGVVELLRDLRRQKRTLCLATSKPEPFARQILDHFQISRFFSVVAGAELQGPRNSKADVLRYACVQSQVTNMRVCLMVGDRKYDVAGAHAVGMACAGVLYGYGPRAELEEAGADYLCGGLEDVRGLLLQD